MYWIVVRTPIAAICSGVMKSLSQGANRARLRRAAGDAGLLVADCWFTTGPLRRGLSEVLGK
eukprot:14451430-Heterocapsa_arctica.AAC.1